MIAQVIHLFRRNPFSSVGMITNENGISFESSQIHKNNHYQVLSYFDGMCLHEIDNISNYIDDNFCQNCVGKCEWREMAIHCERKKMLLYSENDKTYEQISGPNATLSDVPLFALISIRLLMINGTSHSKTTIETEEKNINEYIHQAKSNLGEDDIVFFKSFQSLANDDIFLMIYVNNWLSIEKVLTYIRQRYSDIESINHQYLQTYSILGYDKNIINRLLTSCVESKENSSILEYRYNMGIRMQLIPGIDPCRARLLIHNSLPEGEDYLITSIAGNYDLDIRGRICIRDYVTCIQDHAIFGWNSPISLRTNTQICFLDNGMCQETDNDCNTKSCVPYYEKLNTATIWLQDRMKEKHTRSIKYKAAGIHGILAENMLSVYRNCCQQLVRPKVWSTFQDIQDVLQRYFELVDIEIDNLITLDNANTESSNVDISLDHRRENLENSMHYMMNIITILTNERLSLDFPSYERIGNTIYEKGAYEELIQCWAKWLQILESTAYVMDCLSRNERPVPIDQRASMKNNDFHITFVIVPHQYSQTKTSLQLQYRHDKKRVVVVNISLREMVRFKEMLATLAHEVGHYAGISLRNRRQFVFLNCVNAFTIDRMSYLLASTNKSNEDTLMMEVNGTLRNALNKALMDQMEGNPEAVYLDMCGNYLYKYWVNLINNGKVEGNDLVSECYYDILTNYSLTGSIEALSVSGKRNIEKSCEQGIVFFRSLLRELNADLFMITLLGMPLVDYLHTIGDQKNRYSHIAEVKTTDDSNDDIWTSLYIRIMCVIHVCYSPQPENSMQDHSSFLNIVKKSLKIKNDIEVLSNGDILVKKMQNMIELLEDLVSDKESSLSRDPQYWRNLINCMQAFIIPYLKETQKRIRIVIEDHPLVANRLNKMEAFYHQFHDSLDNHYNSCTKSSSYNYSLQDLSRLLALQKDEDLLHEIAE